MSLPVFQQPAGLSSDTLDPPTPQRHAMQDDQWSAHDTVESDDERDVMEEAVDRQEDLTIQASKLTAATDKTHEVEAPSPTATSPTAAESAAPHEADTTSVHSLPVVQVTEHPMNGPMTSRSASSAYPVSPTTSLTPTATSSLDRRTRNRATMDARASNRISGFFSNLIHRRDHPPPPPPREAMSSPTPPPKESSRASSPLPSRPSTPPPPLPAPSLTDLGLSLSSVTAPLSPSHFSSPPCSGAFLQPHYLLLCHAQGLDVLPLVSPPAPQPYSLIRRVPFKSVVVMEHRGVLVAIAGRRDGVRVYALEEIKRAVEWRIELEVKRERDKNKREELKRALVTSNDDRTTRSRSDQKAQALTSSKSRPDRRATVSVGSPSAATPSRNATIRRPKTPPIPVPPGPPPEYSAPSRSRANSIVPINPSTNRARTTSVNDVLAGTMTRNGGLQHQDSKADWGSSDDEAIDPVTAPSGSQALDERTSANAGSRPTPSNGSSRLEVPTLPHTTSMQNRRSRPANLDLSLTRANPPSGVIATAAPPSPTPTLVTLRQTLMTSPGSTNPVPTRRGSNAAATNGNSLSVNLDEDEDDGDPAPSSPTTPTRERISLAEALMESRLPEVAPVGSTQPQEAILLSSVGSGDDDVLGSPRTSESFSIHTRRSVGDVSMRRRRRWSVFDGIFQPSSSPGGIPEQPQPLPAQRPEMRERQASLLSRSQSTRALPHPASDTNLARPSTAPGRDGSIRSLPNGPAASANAPAPPPAEPLPQPSSSSGSRFLPRIITNAFHSRRSEDQPGSPKTVESRRSLATPVSNAPAPAPKLEYVKLPGTKGSVMIKAVETAKKSFLAILCGENGEKVELFAGTYRTALGLSRTFILPDSPRSLELQLQGDDLVEVFLVFSQNVFGLEPATVRVREVRIGRAERRAARRRARENQQAIEPADGDNAAGDDDTAVNVTIGVAVTPASPTATDDHGNGMTPLPSPAPGALHPADTQPPQTTETASATVSTVNTDELLTLAAAHNSPYTTFQQLTFAPNFPLATIADDYIIPPTYPSFLQYRKQHEPESDGQDLTMVQFSPPGLPAPVVAPPCQWYYRDPKGVIHGPWTAAVMQQWFKEGLLPLDLPVRREEDTEYILLKDLRLQCVDPMYPFRSSPPPPPSSQTTGQILPPVDPSKPLLQPISLLAQPKHFGPPALFFSSRGGHSTTIVDARGRSVLKGRFLWSTDDDEESILTPSPRLGDVKRLEAFDVQDRAVLVAMRQGGLEAVDFGDALLLPADHSRTLLPHFHPTASNVNRRGPFVWKIGTPTSSSSGSPQIPALPPKPAHRFHGKKQSTGLTKSPGRADFLTTTEGDADHHRDEVFFLGRKEDQVYFCERRQGSFRILRISPSSSS